VSPHYTSQECADCSHAENADLNKAKVIKKRAIKLINHSGTELSKTGVLTNPDIGHGELSKTLEGKPTKARLKKPRNRKELSKKKELALCA